MKKKHICPDFTADKEKRMKNCAQILLNSVSDALKTIHFEPPGRNCDFSPYAVKRRMYTLKRVHKKRVFRRLCKKRIRQKNESLKTVYNYFIMNIC